MTSRIKLLIISSFLFVTANIFAQGFLHTDGKKIVDGNGDNFIIRSVGTGNWLIMEGYMMNSSGSAGTHTGFRDKLIETIGIEKTDSFYTKWNHDHMQKIDVDSMAAWGFNAIRVAMHYKWLTLPIEDEPVPGEQTWLEDGFVILDSLLSWCSSNSMYLILDMHGAPGGQGKEAGISDYDPDLPSLWESEENKTKLVALWQKLAQRYADEPWLGGYDLINETNWTFTESNNASLWQIFDRIIDSIRQVDQNHIIILEGNWFANDFNGFTTPSDDNIVLGPHKYWGYNRENSFDWLVNLRNQYNLPVWVGETGENSNTWFTNFVARAEENNIGWSFWPVKKPNINSILSAKINPQYDQLLKYWNNEGPALTEEEAFQAVLKFADNQRFENCVINYNVIDAIIRQPYTTELISREIYEPEDTIYSVDYAFGRNNYAYFDKDTADYHLDTGVFQRWNEGYAYRNDGVDIEKSNDTGVSNDYSVGWTDAGEWLVYLLHNDAPMKYDCILRSASGSSGGHIVFEADGKVISNEYHLPGTDGWYNWSSDSLRDIVLPAGDIQLKVRFTSSGSNFNYFRFTNPRPIDDLEFESLHCETSTGIDDKIYIHVNKKITANEMSVDDFILYVNNTETALESVEISEDSDHVIILKSSGKIRYTQQVKISYTGSSIHHVDEDLKNFEQKAVRNRFTEHHSIPGKIEAEDYYTNVGLVLENCEEDDGQNTGYANPGDYLDYLVYVSRTAWYQFDFRVATERSNAQITLQYEDGSSYTSLKDVSFNSTGGWQNWTTQSTKVMLQEGKYMLRIRVKQGEHNLNWFSVKATTDVAIMEQDLSVQVYPNPARDYLHIEFPGTAVKERIVELYNMNGALMYKAGSQDSSLDINTSGLSSGTFILRIIEDKSVVNKKVMVY